LVRVSKKVELGKGISEVGYKGEKGSGSNKGVVAGKKKKRILHIKGIKRGKKGFKSTSNDVHRGQSIEKRRLLKRVFGGGRTTRIKETSQRVYQKKVESTRTERGKLRRACGGKKGAGMKVVSEKKFQGTQGSWAWIIKTKKE